MRSIQILIIVGFCSHFIFGCTFLPNEQTAKAKKELLAQKEQRFENLRRAILTGSLQEGMTSGELRQQYGEPDDIYVSSSSVSCLEIWSYEGIIMPKADSDWQPIRLYLDNDKLITWKY